MQWLLEHHPQLHLVAEADKKWLWLPVDLRNDPATRESIKSFGFRYKRNGVHLLPSGKGGTWGNACDAPTRFIKRGGQGVGNRGHKSEYTDSPLHNKQVSALRADPLAESTMALDDIAAAFA